MDIEDSGRGQSSSDLDLNAFYTEERSEYENATHRLNRTDAGSRRDRVATQAVNRLGRIYVPLKSTKTASETKLVLLQMRDMYTGGFNKPRHIVVLLVCRYYLWRLGHRS